MEVIAVVLFSSAILCMLAVYFNRIILMLDEILKILRHEFEDVEAEKK